MAKNKGHHRPEAMPLPETVKDALLRLPKDMSYVSHSVKVEGEQEAPEKSELTSENHAFYLGKIIPHSFGDKVRKLLGWGGEDGRIYTPEVIKGMLDYAFQHVKDGEKVRLVTGSSLSELFNGPEDMENVLTLEKQRELIHKIARKKFNKDEDSLEIISFEEEKAHMLLYQVLEENIDKKTGVVDVAKALGSIGTEIQDYHEVASRIDAHKPIRDLVKISPEAFFEAYDPNSLRFAAILYQAFEGDDRFRAAIENTVPLRIKESDSPSADYYGLIEIAMRLSDIARGRFIHGGVERQEIYDQIIAKIIKGKDGGYKNIKALEPLFDVFEGKRFETVHLKTRENYYELKKRRNLARCRMLLTVVLGGGTALGIYNYGRHVEREESEIRQKLIDSKIYDRLKDITLYYHGPFMERSKQDNVNVFHEVVGEIQEDIMHRYEVSEDIMDRLKPFIQDFLLRNKLKLSSAEDSGFNRIDLTDLFVKEQILFFENEGIETSRPHQDLIPYIPAFREFLHSNEDLIVDDGDKDATSTNNERGMESEKMEFEYIGTFYSGEAHLGDYNKYEFYWCQKKDGKRHLVAKDGKTTYSRFIGAGPASHDETEECNQYSTKRAKEGVKQFLYSVRRFDAIGLIEHQSLLYDLHNRTDYEGSKKMLCKDLSQDVHEAELMGFGKNNYRDFLGEFQYEFIIGSDFDRDTFATKKCLLARKPGESEFTDKRAHEMTARYFELIEDAYKYTHHDYPDFSKPDMKYTSAKINMAKQLIKQVENKFECVEDFYALSSIFERLKEDIKELEEALKNSDGSDSSNRKINELVIELEETQKGYIEEIQEYNWSYAETVENLNEILQTRDAVMNVTWPEPKETSAE